MSTLFVNNLNTASGTDITVASGKTIKAPGMIVQVQSGQTDTQFTKSSSLATFSDVGLAVTITPKFSNSKIFVMATGNGYAAAGADNPLHKIIRTVGGTATSIAATDYMFYSGHGDGTGGAYVQSVMDTAQSTAAHEYKIQIRSDSSGGTVYFNVNDTNNQGVSDEAQRSTIMVMEIAQ
tara:strand:+ start:474 stop:1010 length:537 start_codon:yes stop_codon:yes gene_type:complete